MDQYIATEKKSYMAEADSMDEALKKLFGNEFQIVHIEGEIWYIRLPDNREFEVVKKK